MRYFFHIQYADEMREDDEGQEYPDFNAARADAFISVRAMLAHHINDGYEKIPVGLTIADEHGQILDTVTLKSAIPDELR